MIANAIVLTVFFRQGFKDGVNISLTSMVMWDLLKCVCIIINRMERPISLISPSFSESWFSVTVIYTEFFFIISCHVTYVLASYVSVERCLYVSIPFKVRSIFTPTFTLEVVSVISGLVFGSHLVVLFLFRVVYVTSLKYNVTLTDTTYTVFYELHGKTVMTFYNTLGTTLPLVSFVVLCLASLITMYQLKQASSKITRHTGNPVNAASKNHEAKHPTSLQVRSHNYSNGMSQKEKKVNKMLLVVMFVYIAILFPRLLYYMASLIQPEYGLFKKYHTLFTMSSKVLFVFDVVNAATNIFIFFKMSSNFRAGMSQNFSCARCMHREI
ncbi:unnamed protein product [Candidula unifasciata]|uniref:G-protein coupled receptors family 1 profile domain-containing protein n=1 Tax=Candidula unifasciata TaxID=100452 RepID=A0A8S3ZM67_9EUPU|nr:unnamed protein product [Candidula unifasciata]